MPLRSCSPRPAAPSTATGPPIPTTEDQVRAAALAVRRLEAGRRVLRAQLVGRARRPERRDAPRQHLRPAPDAARRGRRRRDLQLPAVGRRAVHALRPRDADARLRARARRRRRAARRQRPQRRSTTSARASRRTSRRSMRASPRPPDRPPSPVLADLRPGELRALVPGRLARSQRARLGAARSRSPTASPAPTRPWSTASVLPPESEPSLACREVASATHPSQGHSRFPRRSSPAGPDSSAPTSAKHCSAAATACSAWTTSRRGR